MLIANPRRVLTRSRILEEVWGFDFPTSGNALEVYVGYLRRKTEAEGSCDLIHTVRGVGYVLRETPPLMSVVKTWKESFRGHPRCRPPLHDPSPSRCDGG